MAAQKKKLGTDLDPAAVDQFTEFCAQRKLVKAEAARLAFALFRRLPLRCYSALIAEQWDLLEAALDQAERHLREQAELAEAAVAGATASAPGCKGTRSKTRAAAR